VGRCLTDGCVNVWLRGLEWILSFTSRSPTHRKNCETFYGTATSNYNPKHVIFVEPAAWDICLISEGLARRPYPSLQQLPKPQQNHSFVQRFPIYLPTRWYGGPELLSLSKSTHENFTASVSYTY